MKIANIHEAKSNLSRLIESVLAGEEVVIAKAGKPLVRLVVYQEKKPRTPGGWEGQVAISSDFDDELPPEILAGFMGEEE